MLAAYNLLNWKNPGGFGVRATGGGVEFWRTGDGLAVPGDDTCLGLSVAARSDSWLYADAQGNCRNPQALENVAEAPSSDVSTAVRIVPDGDTYPTIWPDRRQDPPADDSFVCYRIGVRCHRLLLVQNAMLREDGEGRETCDLSRARVVWMAPREEDHREVAVIPRPLRYPPGPDMLPSALENTRRDLEISPRPSGIGTPVRPDWHQKDGRQAVRWKEDPPHSGEWHRAAAEDGPGYDAELDSMFVRDYWTGHWSGEQWIPDFHELWWTTAEQVPPAENVLAQLAGQDGLVRRVFGGASGIRRGTAFDMALLCKTYDWHKRMNIVKKLNGRPYRVVWAVRSGERGYFNTKISGYLAQIAPVPPKERRTA